MAGIERWCPVWARNNLSALGLVAAVSAFGASLTPSLMPRAPLVQSVLSGVSASLAYEAVLLVIALLVYLEIPPLPKKLRGWWAAACGLASLAILVYSLSKAATWQNATRTAVELAPLETGAPLLIFFAGAFIAAVLWLLFRMLGIARRLVSRFLERLLPRRVGVVLSVALTGWLFWALVDGAFVRSAFKAADASFMAADVLIEPDIPQPLDPMKSGSAASLIRWTEMGRWGRSFVATAPAASDMSRFHSGPVRDPIRVYVGRLAAETAQERAEIALEELRRVGGFNRSVLVVAIPVGTGWMDPGAHDTLDFMLAGDTATVAVQYSYLTSALSLLAHPEYGVQQARALFDVVYDYWTALPKDQRPELYVHGLSQGAFNSQATLPLLDMLGDPIQGAMWAGSPFFSRYWAQVRDDRNLDSPAWRPTFGNGSLIRVIDQYGGLDGPFAPWGPIRAVFLNYGSDPIVNFTFDSAVFPPAWLNGPRAPDVSDKLTWFPIVTMLQLALDSLFSLDVPRFGHYYVAADYIDAWAAVIEPDGWSSDRSSELKRIFDVRPDGS